MTHAGAGMGDGRTWADDVTLFEAVMDGWKGKQARELVGRQAPRPKMEPVPGRRQTGSTGRGGRGRPWRMQGATDRDGNWSCSAGSSRKKVEWC
jgi:hypothetical protein